MSLGALRATVEALVAKKEPWTSKQTHADLLFYVRKELLETEEAIRGNASAKEINAELGDVLFDCMLLIAICQRDMAGGISIESAAESAVVKLTRRCPHLFTNGKMPEAHEAEAAWQRAKREERKSADDGTSTLTRSVYEQIDTSARRSLKGADQITVKSAKTSCGISSATQVNLLNSHFKDFGLEPSDLEGLGEWEAAFRRELDDSESDLED